MRTNRLRRWLLRGVLISSAALSSAGLSQSAQADVTWNNAPQGESVQQTEPVVDPEFRIESDITWN